MLVRIPTIEVSDEQRKAINLAFIGTDDLHRKATSREVALFVMEKIESEILGCVEVWRERVKGEKKAPKPEKAAPPRIKRFVIGGKN